MVYNDTQKINIFIELIVYFLSIIVPIGIILLETVTGNISEMLYINMMLF